MAALRYFYLFAVLAYVPLARTLSSKHEYIVGRESDSGIFSVLASQLSPGAAVILPDNPRMSVHQRWQAYSQPTYSAVVEVAVEEDVAKTVIH